MADDTEYPCPTCHRPFTTEAGLSRHLNASGHGKQAKAAALVEALASTSARAVPCLFPSCSGAFRTQHGLRIHQTLRGHQRPKDSLQRGDGPQPEPTVHRGPRNPKPDLDCT